MGTTDGPFYSYATSDAGDDWDPPEVVKRQYCEVVKCQYCKKARLADDIDNCKGCGASVIVESYRKRR